MAGYVLTTKTLGELRSLVWWIHGTSDGVIRDKSGALLEVLDHTDGLDADNLREVAEWAGERAKCRSDAAILWASAGAETGHPDEAIKARRRLAECDRIIELCDGVLVALAESNLPAGAMRVVGRERLAEGGDLPVEPAANTITRERFEAIPSADRVVLGQIMATLRGEPRTSKPHEGMASDVLAEIGLFLHKLAAALGVDHNLEAPELLEVAMEAGQALMDSNLSPTANTLPEDHPLRCYRWADWLRYLIRVEELGAGSGYLAGDRLAALWDVLARVELLDVDGLRGVLGRVSLDGDVTTLLRYAMGGDSHNSTIGFGADGVSRCRHRVPAVERERGGA